MEISEFFRGLEVAASAATITALVIVIIQQVRQSRAIEADVRAFLHLSVQKETFKDKRAMVTLSIFNSGDVTAQSVRIRPTTSSTWFALQGQVPPEFAKSESTLSIRPGEEIKFLLGPLGALEVYEREGVEVECNYIYLPRKRKGASELTTLTLTPQRYVLERKIH